MKGFVLILAIVVALHSGGCASREIIISDYPHPSSGYWYGVPNVPSIIKPAPVEEDTVLWKVQNDPSRVVFLNKSQYRVRVEVDTVTVTTLTPFIPGTGPRHWAKVGMLHVTHLQAGKHEAKFVAIVERPTEHFGVWKTELTKTQSFEVKVWGGPQLLEIEFP